MIRAFTAISLVTCIFSGSALYNRSNKTASLHQKIEGLHKQREEAIDHTKLLRMKWSLLNQPERLENLSHKFLPNLRPSRAVQYASLNGHDLDKMMGVDNSRSARIELAQNTTHRVHTDSVRLIHTATRRHVVHTQTLTYHAPAVASVKVPTHAGIALAVHKHSRKTTGLVKLASYRANNSALPAPTPFE